MKDFIENVLIVALVVMAVIMFLTINASGLAFIVSAGVAIALASTFTAIEAADMAILWWHNMQD